jgi:hypothetical protein
MNYRILQKQQCMDERLIITHFIGLNDSIGLNDLLVLMVYWSQWS